MKKQIRTRRSFKKALAKKSIFAAPLLIGLAQFSTTLNASVYVWSATGASPWTDGSGSWLASGGTNWVNTNSSYTYGGFASGNDAWFGVLSGAAGTITVGNVAVNAMVFNQAGSGNYTLSSGTITLNTAGNTGAITANVNATIGSTLAGTNGLTKSGVGTLTLTGSNSYTGTTTVNNGTLTLNAATGSLKSTSPLTMNGGIFKMDNVGASGALSATLGALTFNAGDATVQTTQTVAQNEALTFSSLAARTAGATGNFVNGGNATNSGLNGFVLTGVTADSFINNGIFYGGSSYAWNDAGGFVRAINYGTDAGATTSSGAASLASGTYQQIAGAISAQNTATFTNLNISGNNNLTLAASQTLTVNGILKSGNVAGGATIGGGTGIQAATGAELVVRTDGANDALTVSTPILANGSNALTKSGAGTLTLSATNAYTGVTYIDGGILNLGSAGALAGGGNITFGGGTLQYSASNTTDYSGKIVNSTGAISIDTNGQNVAFGSALASSNSGGFTKNGAGTLTLNIANSFTGITTINGGTLKMGAGISAGGALNSGLVVVNSGATLDLNNTNSYWLSGGVAGNGTIISSTNTNPSLGMNGNYWNQTFSGTMSNIGIDFRAQGATWNLAGVSTNINGAAFGWSAIAPNASTINLSGTLVSTQTVTVGNNGSANFNVNGGLLQLTNANGYLTIATDDYTQGSCSSVFGSVTLTSGTIIAPNINTKDAVASYTTGNSGPNNPNFLANTGAGNIYVNGGVLNTRRIFNQSNAASLNVVPMTIALNGGTILSYASDNLFADGGYASADELSVQIGNNGATINTAGFTSVSQRPLSNVSGQQGNLTKTGAGQLNLSGSATFSGRTIINQGTLSISNDSNLGPVSSPVANQVELNGGTLNFSSCLSSVTLTSGSGNTNANIGTATVNNVTGAFVKLDNSITALTGGTGGAGLSSSNVTVMIGAPDMPGGIQASATAVIVGGVITGYNITNPGSGYSTAPFLLVTKTSGTWQLPSAAPTVSTYALSGSTPVIWSEGIIPSGNTPTITVNNITGAVAVTTSTSASLQANRGIQLDAGGGTLDVSTYATGFIATVNGPISGPGALTKSGSGILVLTNTNNSYAGGTVISKGILEAPSGSVIPNLATNLSVAAGASVGLAYGGPSDWTPSQIASLLSGTGFAAGSGIALDTTNLSGTYSSNIANTISVTKLGANTLTLSGSNSYNGGTVIDGGILALGNPNALGTTGTISFGSGLLQGTLQYSGSNTTDYSARIGASAGAIAIDTNGQNVTLASSFVGVSTGGLTKNGSGTLQLGITGTGNNYYNQNNNTLSGPITINAGTLKQGYGNESPWTNNNSANTMTIAAGATFDLGGNNNDLWIFNLSGSGTITNSGAAYASQLINETGTSTFAGSFQKEGGGLDVNLWLSNGTINLTGSSAVTSFYLQNAANAIANINGGYLSASFIAVGSNNTGDILNVNGGTVTTSSGNTLRIGWNGSGNSGVVLNSGTIVADYVNRSGGSGLSTYLTLNGGVLYSKRIGQNDTSATSGMTLTINGGTIVNTAADTLFNTIGYLGASASNELVVQIGGGGAAINTNGYNTSSTRPIADVAGQHGSLTKLGAGIFTLSAPNTYTGASIVNAGTLKEDFTAFGSSLTSAPSNYLSVSSGLTLGGGVFSLLGRANGSATSAGAWTTGTAGSTLLTFTTLPSGVVVGQGVTGTGIPANDYIVSINSGSKQLTLSASTTATSGADLATAATTVTTSQAVSGLTVNPGVASVVINANGGGGTVLSLGTIPRSVGGTVDFTLPTGTQSASNGVLTTATNTNGIIGGWATVSGTDWATNSGGNVVGLSAAGAYVNNTWASGSNTTVTTSSSPASGSVTNSLRFAAAGANTIALTGTNTLSSGGILVTSNVGNNPSSISGGVLQGAAGQDLVVIQNNASNGLTISSAIVDNGSATGLTKSGSGILTLTGNNSFTGATNLGGGILNLGSASALPGAGTIVFAGGTLQYSGANQTDYSSRFVGGSGVLSIDTNGQNVAFATNLGSSFSGGLAKSGLGTLTLSASNNYSGVTAINAGSLQFSKANSLYGGATANWTPTNLSVASSGTIAFNVGGTNEFTNSNVTALLGSLLTVNSNGLKAGSTIGFDTTNASGGVFTIPDNIGNSTGTGSGAVGVTKLGGGALVLTGSDTFTGATTIVGGTLQIGNGTIGSISSSGSVTVNAGGTLAVNLANTGTFGSAIYNNGTVNFLAGGTNTVSGNIYGVATASMSQSGTGTTILSGLNQFFGTTNITAGTLMLSSQYAGWNSSENVAVNNGLAFGANAVTIGALSGSGNVVLLNGTNGVALTMVGSYANSSPVYSGVLSGSGGSLTYSGTGQTLTLTGNNSYSGNTTISSGATLQLGNGGTVGMTGTGSITNSGTLAFNRTDNYGGNFTNPWVNGNGTLILNSGTLVLANGQNLPGPAVVNGGVLKLLGSAGSGYLSNGSLLTVNSGGTMDFNSSGQWMAGITGNGTLRNANNALLGGNGWNYTFSGNMVNMGIDFRAQNATWNLTGSSNITNGNGYGWGATPALASTINLSGTYTSGWMYLGNQGSNTFNVLNGGLLSVGGAGLIIGNEGGPGEGQTVNAVVNITNGTVTGAYVLSQLTGTNNASTTGTATLNLNSGGVLNTQKIYTAAQTYQGGGLTLNINGGTINATASDWLFCANGAASELTVNIGNSGAIINVPSGITSVSQRPIGNIPGQLGSLTKSGSGTLQLSGSGTYTGQTLINGGLLRITNDSNLGVVSAPVANQVELNSGTLNFSSCVNGMSMSAWASGSSSSVYTATVNNSTAVAVKLSNQILGITGLTGTTVVTSTTAAVWIGAPDMPGGVQATAVPNIVSGTIAGYTITNPGSGYSVAPNIYVYNPSNPANTNGVGGLSGAGFYYGLVSGASPVLLSEGIVTGASALSFNNGAGSSGTATTTSSVALASNRGIQLDAAGGTLDVSNYPVGFTATVNGAISGSGALAKTGAGTLVLTASNTYSGGTTLTAGTLQLASANALGATAGSLTVNAGTLDLNGNSATVGTLSGSTGAVITTSSNASVTLSVGGAVSSNFAGVIQNGTGTVALVKQGSGTLTLSASNNYSGGTQLSAGTLNYGNVNALGSGTATFAGVATLQAGASGAISNAILINSGVTGAIDTQAYTVTLSGAVSGPGALTKIGSGTLTLTGSNSYSGTTAINGGILALGNAGALGASSAIAFAGGTLQYSGANQVDYSGQIAGSAGAIAINTNGQNVAFASPLASSNVGGLSKSGSGTLTLSASNSYSGATSVNGGILALGNASALSAGTLKFGGGTLQYSGANQVDYSSQIANSAGAISIDTNGQSITFGSALASSNTGGLVKNGNGTLTLSASNSYGGATAVNGGILALANANALNATGTISFGGGTLQYSGANTTDYSARIGAGPGAISIDTNGQNVTFASSFVGTNTGGLTKNGGGTLFLNGSNSNLTGPITINGGTLSRGTINSTSWNNNNSADTMTIASGATYDLDGNNSNIWIYNLSGAGVMTNSSATRAAQLIAGSGTTTFAGSFLNGGVGTKLLDVMYSGNGYTVNLTGSSSCGDFRLWGLANGTFNLSAGGYLNTDFVSVGENSGGTVFNVNGGTLLTTNNGGSVLRVGWNGGGTVNLNSGTITAPYVNRSGGSQADALNINGGTLYTQQISNDVFWGVGMVATLNGGTIVATNSDRLFADSGESAANELSVQIGANGGTINTNGYTTSSQRPLTTVSGTSGNLTKTGAGSLNLSGSGSFNGRTIINQGTVSITDDSNLGVVSAPVANQVELNGGALNFSSKLTGATLTSGSGILTSSATYGSGTIGGDSVTNQTGAFVKLDNSVYALTSGTGGSGLSGVTVTIGAPDIAGGIQATGSATVVGGVITGYTITNPGSGYSITPPITLGKAAGTLPGNPTFRFELSGNAPVIWSEGIVTGASTLSLSGYAGAATASVTTSSSASLSANRGIQLDAGGGALDVSNYPIGFTATVNGTISGVGALTKTGAGTLVLAGSNNYSGGTTVSGGTLQLGNANALGASAGALTVNAGTLDLNGNSVSVGALSGTSGIITNSSSVSVLTANVAGSSAFNGSIRDGSGSVALVNQGSGTLTLAGSNSYSGGTAVNGGILALGNANALGASGNVSFGGGTLQFSVSNTADYSSRIAGSASAITIDTNGQSVTFGSSLAASNSGGLIKTGNGMLTLSGSNSYGGNTTVSSGTLQVGNANALGAGGLTANGGTLDLHGNSIGVGFLSGLAGMITTSVGGAVTLTAGGDNSNTTFSGSIQDGSGSVSLFKAGTGMLTLSGSSGFGGGTTVNSGTLGVAGDSALGAVTGAVTLNDGGTVQTAGTFDFDANRNFVVSGGTATIDTQSNINTVNGSLSGAGVLAKSGSGSLIVSGSVGIVGLNANAGLTQLAQSGSIGALNLAGSATVALAAHSGSTYNVLSISSLTIAGFSSDIASASKGASYTAVANGSQSGAAGVLTDTGRAVAQAASSTATEAASPEAVPEPGALGLLLSGLGLFMSGRRLRRRTTK